MVNTHTVAAAVAFAVAGCVALTSCVAPAPASARIASLAALSLPGVLAASASTVQSPPGLDLPGVVQRDLSASEQVVAEEAVPVGSEATKKVDLAFRINGTLQLDSVAVGASDASAVVALLNSQPSVVAASVPGKVAATSDPYTPDPSRALQWGLDKLQAESVRPLLGATSPVVAVVDTGVDGAHPDLAGVLVPGYDFITSSSDVSVDPNGHGTHVAGIIGADVGNGIGVEGFLPNAHVMPIRALASDGSGSTYTVAQGVLYAVAHGAKVINLSLGGPDPDPVLESALTYADSQGVVVASAMGNGGEVGSPSFYPAMYESTLAVGATTPANLRASLSSIRSDIDLAAPGMSIMSTDHGGGYGYMQGTSIATPFVSAVAAGVLSAFPNLTPQQVRTLLESTATDLGAPGVDTSFGYGLVNPLAALTRAPDAPTLISVVSVDAAATITWTAPISHGGSPLTRYTVSALADGQAPLSVNVAASTLTTTVSGLTNGASYSFRVTATNAVGTSVPSASLTTTPGSVPSTPTLTGVTPGNGSAVVTWTAPVSSGSSALTGYAVTSVRSGFAPVEQSVSGSTLSTTVSGLANGVLYTFTVKASNLSGASAASASQTATPATVPGAPSLSSASPRDSAAVVTWATPASSGGTAITGYIVTTTRSGQAPITTQASASTLTTTISGLTNDNTYTFSVVAANAIGSSHASNSLNARPGPTPGTPTLTSLVAANASALLAWDSSVGIGSSPTGYTIKVVNAATGLQVGPLRNTTTSTTRLTVTGLANGTAVKFQVQASNLSGPGSFSGPSNAVTPVAVNTTPIGNVDAVGTTAYSISVAGWTLDPDTNDSIGVHIYIDGRGMATTANRSRPDVGRVFGRGALHGFSSTISATPGNHSVCIYAINAPSGFNPSLICRTVTVANATPFGHVDAVSTTPNNINVAGWALDPDTNDPIAVHIYVDGRGMATTANLSRPDVGRVFGRGDLHGFSAVIPAVRGRHNICIYAINTPSGTNPALQCANVTV